MRKAGQEGGRIGRRQDRREAGQEGGRTRGRQDRREDKETSKNVASYRTNNYIRFMICHTIFQVHLTINKNLNDGKR